MLIVDDEAKVDLKSLKDKLECSKLEFASDEDLAEILHTYQGNVSVFNMKYDVEDKVNLIVDEELLDRSLLAFHPLYNGKSLFLTPVNFLKYLLYINRKPVFTQIPKREEVKELVKVL